MADYQRVIEFLRDVRQGAGSGGVQTVNDEITHMAGEYAALCAAANDRLRKCSGFLQQGLRAEAIHLAEEQPNLLDLIAQLDLPDPQSWAEFCSNNGLPVPPPLQLERAAQLNEAYAQDQPLEHLMARHRLLALSRAPVRERLDVMRKIAQIDANAGTWEKDLRIFEKARLKELPSAFYNAVKNHDTRAINGLVEELQGQVWFEAPPADLLAALMDAHQRIQRSSVEGELKKLVEPLREAFAARSLQECQALVQRWKNIMAAGNVSSVASELMDEIRPVVAFIAEQTKRDDYVKRFNEACKTFARMMDADQPDAQLEAGYARLKEFREEIPEDLTRRYMNKRTGRRKDADRRHKTTMAIIAGVCLLLLAGVLVVVWAVMHKSNAQKWAQGIDNAVAQHTAEGLLDGQKRVDDLKAREPSLLSDPLVAAAVSKLQVAQQQFTSDAASAEAAAAKLEKARQAASQTMQKADASMDEIRTVATDLDAAINEASEILKTAEWADSQGKLRAAIAGAQSVRQTMLARVQQAVRGELKSIGDALDAVPANVSTPAAAMDTQNQLTVLATRINKLSAWPLLDASSKTDITAVTDRIAKRRQAADVAGGMAGELQKIRTATSAAELRAALSNFADKFPSDPRTADFKTSLTRVSAAEAQEAWRAKVAALQDLAPANAADAQKKLDDVASFLTAHPDLPKFAAVKGYSDYLQRAVDALGSPGTWQTALAPILGNTLLRDLSVVEVSDGRKFYTIGDIQRKEQKFNGQVTAVTFLSINTKPGDNGIVDYLNPQLRQTVVIQAPAHMADPIPAPHAKVVSDLAEAIKTVSQSNWDTLGVDLADKLARNDQMEIVVKAILLQQTLKTEQAVGGDLLGDIYDRTLDSLTRQKAEDLPWPDPSKVSDDTRKAIKKIIDDMPAASTARQRLATSRSLLFKALSPDIVGMGVLLKDDGGAWGVQTHATPLNGQVVWAVMPAGEPAAADKPAPTTLTMVGAGAGGKFILDESALRNVPQGNIVFITRQ